VFFTLRVIYEWFTFNCMVFKAVDIINLVLMSVIQCVKDLVNTV